MMVRTKMAWKWTLGLEERVHDVTWIGMMILLKCKWWQEFYFEG
jgi:hypothetical protein